MVLDDLGIFKAGYGTALANMAAKQLLSSSACRKRWLARAKCGYVAYFLKIILAFSDV